MTDLLLVLWNRIRHLLRPRRLERELREEMEFHRQMAATRRATHQARPFGSMAMAMEDSAAAWRPSFVIAMERDIGFALRLLWRSPGFSIAAALLLGAGFVLNASLFSAARALLYSAPSEVSRPEELLLIGRSERGDGFDTLSYADYRAYRDRATTLVSAAAYQETPVHLRIGGQTVRVDGMAVSESYFRTLGAGMQEGRDWSDREDKDESFVAVMNSLCAKNLGATTGAAVFVNGNPAVVSGITAFQGLDPTRPVCVWIPLAASRRVEAQGKWLSMIARRAATATPRQVAENLRAVQSVYVRESGEDGFEVRVDSRFTLHPGQRAGIEQLGVILMAVAFVVLAISTANLCSLLLGRALKRQAEMKMRANLGASRGVLFRQVVVECLLLGVLGAAVGLVLSEVGAPLWATILRPPASTVRLDLRPDLMTVGFAFGLALVTLPLYAFAPALEASRGTGRRVRPMLVTLQIALSCALVLISALLARSVRELRGRDLGLRPQGLVSLTVDLGLNGYSAASGSQFYRRLVERASVLPGVTAATIARQSPLDPAAMDLRIWQPGSGDGIGARANYAGPGYFTALGVPLVAGRDISANDSEESLPVAWINESAARRLFGSRPAVGARIQLTFETSPREIVGVVGDYSQRGPLERPRPAVFAPLGQRYFPSAALIVRCGSPGRTLQMLREVVASLDPNLPPSAAMTFADRLDALLWRSEALTRMVTGFGLLALLMAATGIYGLIALLVAQRHREIGIRMALGASPSQVLRLAAESFVRQFATGVSAGLLVAAGSAMVLRSHVPGLVWYHPGTYGLAVGVMVVAGLAAAAPSLLRAVRVDPVVALRQE